MSQKSYNSNSSLYLVPTPIGNMDDITLRSINILKQCDIIFSEDTRETKKLLTHLGITKKLISYHKFNEDKVKEKVIESLSNGQMVVIVSDRGTPAISDPGYVAAYAAIEKGYNVIGLPGPTAFVPALITSGINPNKFLFYGFLSSKKSQKKKELEELKNINYTLIFYESPYRIRETIELIRDVLKSDNVSISREISKKYEEIYRGTPDKVLEELLEPKGEFVIIVDNKKDNINYEKIDILEHINKFINEGISEKEAIKKVAKLHNLDKNTVYMKYHGGK